MIDVHAVVDLWSKSTRTEAVLNDCVTGLSSIAHGCTAASARTIFIMFAWHTFAFIFVTICRARGLLGGLFRGFCCSWLNCRWFNFRFCRFLSWFFFSFCWSFWIHLWRNSVTGRLHSFFAILVLCFICFAIDWLGLLFFDLPFLLVLFSLFRCLLLRSNSVVLLRWLNWNFKTFVLLMWDNRLQMRMIRSEISLNFVFVCTSITMVIMVSIFMWREVLVLIVRCYFVVLLVQLVFRLVSMLSVLKFTPFLFGNRFVMNFWFPYVTT